MDVGANIRRRRARLGLTLAVLARGSGVSRAMLSDVERGRRSPTVKILTQIAIGLGCRVADLLEDPPSRQPHVETAARHARVLDETTGVERVTLAAPYLTRGLEVVLYRLPAGTTMRRGPEAVTYVTRDGQGAGPFPPNPPGTAEHLTVVRGRVSLAWRDRVWELGVGDAVNYRLDEDVVLGNPGRHDCQLSLLIDPGPSGSGKD